jgi:hypothetical protein
MLRPSFSRRCVRVHIKFAGIDLQVAEIDLQVAEIDLQISEADAFMPALTHTCLPLPKP